MSKVQVLIAGELMTDDKAHLVYQVLNGCFTRLHYRLLFDMPPDTSVEPTEEDVKDYQRYVEMLYLFDPEQMKNRFTKTKAFSIVDGKVVLNFTLEQCIATFHDHKQERIAAHKEHVAKHFG